MLSDKKRMPVDRKKWQKQDMGEKISVTKEETVSIEMHMTSLENTFLLDYCALHMDYFEDQKFNNTV